MKSSVIKFPDIKQDYYPFVGGMDIVTPSISVSPGTALDSQNYEPSISGGYRRIDGYERFDGRQSPTSANYWVLPFVTTGAVAVGNKVIGLTSGATAYVLAITATYLVLARIVGTFAAGGENIQVTNL